MHVREEALWALRLAADEIADAGERQRFLNALTEMIRLAPTGEVLDPGREQSAMAAAIDERDPRFDIGVYCRSR